MNQLQIMERIKEIKNRPGEKILYKGHAINESDIKEFDSLLIMENILANSTELKTKTLELKEKVLKRLEELRSSTEPRDISEFESLSIIKDIIEETIKQKLEDLTYYNKILVPKKDFEVFKKNLNNTIFRIEMPIKEATKSDFKALNERLEFEQRQRQRIHENSPEPVENKEKDANQMLDDIASSLNTLKQYKTEAIEEIKPIIIPQPEPEKNTSDIIIDGIMDEFRNYEPPKMDNTELSEEEFNAYLNYLKEQLIKAYGNDTASEIYYSEMIKKAKETKVISDPGYKYYLEMQKVNIKKSR